MTSLEHFIRTFAKLHFEVDLYCYQVDIIKSILERSKRKVTIRATTRAGKSFAVAIGAVMFAIFFDGSKVGVLAPTEKKTKIIMTYIAQLLSVSDLEPIVDIDVMKLTKLERLKREVSKQKITFKNNSYIEILTVNLNQKGFGVMGFGYNCTILDETAEIPDEIYSKIYRMLVDDPLAKLVEIGNPWHMNHFFDHHQSKDWCKIHIPFGLCIEEGRMTLEDVEDQRRELTDLEFKVLFEAEFVEQSDDSLFNYRWIKDAGEFVFDVEADVGVRVMGVDVAEMGLDWTVCVIGRVLGSKENFFQLEKIVWWSKKDTEVTSSRVWDLVLKEGVSKVAGDAIGVGKGVFDHLRGYVRDWNVEVEKFNADVVNKGGLRGLIDCEVIDIKYGAKVSKPQFKDRFLNLKAELFWGLRKMFEEGRICIVEKGVGRNFLVKELMKMKYEVSGSKTKIRIVDPVKSPDFVDGLVLASTFVTLPPKIFDFV